jgi:DNA-binding protein H-NS
MRSVTRKGLQDIRTRSSLSGELENPQRKYLHAASLELKKSLCRKVRDAAKKRTEEMEEKIAELDQEQAQLLAASRVFQPEETDSATASPPAGQSGSRQPHGFALKY